MATALREADSAILAVALTKVSLMGISLFSNLNIPSVQSRPDLLEIALTDATEDNLTVALTPASG